jgi:hypothetical protein
MRLAVVVLVGVALPARAETLRIQYTAGQKISS